MNEVTQPIHPLDQFHLKICGIKCFDSRGSGFFKFAPITFIIGKNNFGKSTILDVLQDCCKPSGRMFDGPLSRTGINPFIEIRTRLAEQQLKKVFPSSVRGGTIPGIHHWEYARENILPHEFTWVFDQNRDALVKEEGVALELVAAALEMMSSSLKFPFQGLWAIRIRAERDVNPEQHKKARTLGSSGQGLTNLVRAFINSDDLPRDLIENDLLHDLNEIYLGDSEFTAITCQENEDTGAWEIYLREEGKGDIRLSQSGSSLKTVFLVLAYLRLYPKINSTGSASRLLFLLEEPENNLHPALLRRLIDFLGRQREARGFSLGSSDQLSRLRRDGGMSAPLGAKRGSWGKFRCFWAAVSAVRQFPGRLVLIPSAFFGPGTGCRARTA